MAEWDCGSEYVLLKCQLILSFFLFFDVLFDETTLVVVEVFEQELFIIGIFHYLIRVLSLQKLIYLQVILHYFLFVVFQSIERIEKRKHGFSIELWIADVYLHEKGEWDVVKDVFFQFQGVISHVFKQFRFLSELHMTFKVIYQLFLARMQPLRNQMCA